VRRARRREHSLAIGDDRRRGAVVDDGRREQSEPNVVVLGVVPGEEPLAERPGVLDPPNRSGNSGRYLSVLNCASENGLSFDTRGRACVRVTPRSANSSATGLDVIDIPRSAWIVNCLDGMAYFAQVSRMSRSASVLLSQSATIQPTTYRLKMSRIT
jgi:hypothetical protein